MVNSAVGGKVSRWRGVTGESFFSFYKPCSLNFLARAFVNFIVMTIFILERKSGR